MAAGDRIPIPGTHREVWPGANFASDLASETDVLLTAWLHPPAAGRLDPERANAASAAPAGRRTFVDRAELLRQTGADPDDVASLREYCAQFGLEIAGTHWRSVTISGPLPKLVEAFGATVATYETPEKHRFRHRSQALHVPAGLARAVAGVFGLHQWPRSRKLGALQRHATPLRAADVASRYAFPDGDGSGQTIGVVQLRGIFKPDDFDRCMRDQGIAAAHPVIKRIDDAAVAHELATTQDLEAALDVQILASLAPGARIVVYEAPDDERGLLDAIRAAVFDQEFAADILSISYGWPEHVWTPAALDVLGELLLAAALTGVSVFCSSGDNGAALDDAGTPHVFAPASTPFAIACGATVIGQTGAETAWDGSGGGFSARFDVPPWQDCARAVAAKYSARAARGVPDVAAQVSPGYYVIMDGAELAMGGTSAVAPVWSALTARLTQRLGTRLGCYLPALYGASREKLFTDVTSGSNGRFSAASGWNPCTGLGVAVGTAIENALREPGP